MHNPRFRDSHLSDDDLEFFLDGEMTSRKASQCRDHLAHCWSCQARAAKLQETIHSLATFLDNEQLPSPPRGWSEFRTKLRQCSAAKRPAPAFHFSLRAFSAWKPLWAAAAGVSLLLVLAVTYSIVKPQSVGAAELLRKAFDAQQTARSAKHEPRMVQIRMRGEAVLRRIGGASSPDANQENGQEQAQTALFVDRILQNNHFDVQDPLSVAGFSAWRNSLRDKEDTITKDAGFLTLRTRSILPVVLEGISEVRLTVKRGDYYPVSEVLVLNMLPTPETIEFTEVAAPVFSSPSLEIARQPADNSLDRAHGATAAQLAEAGGATAPASAELELQVRYQIHKVGGDLGQEAAVTRTSQNQLLVNSIVDSGHKRRLMAALSPFQNNPAVHIAIRTSDEVMRDSRVRPGPASTVVSLPNTSLNAAIPASPVLQAYFDSKRIPRSEQSASIQQFSKEVVEHSNNALLHALALQDWLQRFPGEPKSLPNSERQMWRSVIHDHLDAIASSATALRSRLEPLYPEAAQSSSLKAESSAPPNNNTQLIAAALVQCTRLQNQAVHAAFTVSNESTRKNTLNEPGFWRSLDQSQDLVRHLRLLALNGK